jgi:hypothetical protein
LALEGAALELAGVDDLQPRARVKQAAIAAVASLFRLPFMRIS